MMQLHYCPSTASMAPHILLEEIGLPFDRVLVDTSTGAHRTDAYRRLNPNGLVPTLVDGELVLYESAAICLHLCDRHPAASLAPPVGSTERAHFYKWLVWLTNTLQATLIVYFYPERWMPPGETAAVAALKAQAQTRIAPLLDQLDAELARQGQAHAAPWLLGSAFSAVDAYALMLCRWTRHFDAGAARERRHLGPYLERVLTRPAVQRVFAAEGLARPWV
ncbi:MAG: glutathione S-transferase-like protein [Polaromonas sp.]|nr:glutathione S-transferase-like protein [Polaromonas sp.]